jgi:hypothetical protein
MPAGGIQGGQYLDPTQVQYYGGGGYGGGDGGGGYGGGGQVVGYDANGAPIFAPAQSFQVPQWALYAGGAVLLAALISRR